MSKDSTTTISSATKKFVSGTMLSRVSGLGREMITASVFGCHPAIAAFWMAFRFSNLLRRMLGEGAMQVSFIPHFEEMHNKSPGEAVRFFRDLSFGIALFVFALVFIAEGVLWAVLSWGNLDSSNVEVLQLTAIMLPAVLFICLAGLNAGYLQCNRSFFIPAVYSAGFNICWIVSVFLLKYLDVQNNVIAWFSLAVAFSYVVQWLFTVPKTLRYMFLDLPCRFFSGVKWFSKEFLKFKTNLLISIIGVSAAQINSALDVIFARAADSVGPAYLNYAIRLQQLPLALFGVSLAGALLPPMSRAIKKGDLEKGTRFLFYAIKKCTSILIPCTFAILVLAGPAANLVYGRGNFDIESTQYTALCFSAYGLGIAPMALVFLLASACYAHGKYRVATVASIISMVCNVLLNAFFVFVLDMGAVSVAIATSISAFVDVAILLYFISSKIMKTKISEFLFALWRPIVVSGIALVFGVLCFKVLWHISLQQIFCMEKMIFPRAFGDQLLYFLAPAVSFAVALYIGALIFKVKEITDLFKFKI